MVQYHHILQMSLEKNLNLRDVLDFRPRVDDVQQLTLVVKIDRLMALVLQQLR